MLGLASLPKGSSRVDAPVKRAHKKHLGRRHSFTHPENCMVDAGTAIKYSWFKTNVVDSNIIVLTTINFGMD